MNLTRIVDLKERIAISDAFTPEERDFILDAIVERVPAIVGFEERARAIIREAARREAKK